MTMLDTFYAGQNDKSLKDVYIKNLVEKFEKLSLNDLNKILFSLESEERLEINWGIFNIEGLSGDEQFKFCGLESQYVI